MHLRETKSTTPSVAVVIPNWNGEDWLGECVDSLLGQTIRSTIIVVENASVDNSRQILASYEDTIIVLPQERNLGFAGGVNAGIRHAIDRNIDFVALFNNDAVADNTWLESLLKTATSDARIGIVAAKILAMDKQHLDSTGEFYTIFGLPFPRGRGEIDTGQYDHKTILFGASGGASLYRTAMLKQIGLFDEDFFAYYEDADISFRAQLAGWKVCLEPKARVYHRISATSSRISGFSTYQTAKNIPLLYMKNMPSWLFWKYLPYACFWYARIAAARIIRGNLQVFIRGWLQSIALIPKKLQERRQIQHKRLVSIRTLDAMLYHGRPPRQINNSH